MNIKLTEMTKLQLGAFRNSALEEAKFAKVDLTFHKKCCIILYGIKRIGRVSRIRIIISDADKTLLSSGRLKYPREFERMLSECAALGIPFVVASGRTIAALRQIFAEFSERLIFISFDGAYISAGQTRIADFPIGKEAIEQAIALASSNEVNGVELCTAERSYLISKSTLLQDSEKRRLGVEYAPFEGTSEPVYKLIVFTKRGSDIEIPGIHRVYRAERVVELVRSDVDKAKAAKLLCTELGIDPRDMVAFGDGENDRTLLELSGCPVTMYGSRHDVFALSRRHTANVAEYVRFLIKSASTKGNTF